MRFLLVLVVLALLAAVAVAYVRRTRRIQQERALGDARAEAQRWYDRLGGQVLNLSASEPAAQQALADAGERYNAAGSQLEQARTERQHELAGQTALEGLYYVRAARTAMGIDPGPDLPALEGQRAAGAVTEAREATLEGRTVKAAPAPRQDTPYYYPGGTVAGRPVPGGWYSEPFWRTALVAGAWGVGSALLFSTLFTGMGGLGDGAGDDQGSEAQDAGDGGGQGDGADGTDAGDAGGADVEAAGDLGGSDYAGGFGNDFGGFGGPDPGAGGDLGGFGGGDLGGGDF